MEIEIRTSIYMDDISVAGESEEVKKGIKKWKCKKKKMQYSSNKKKYMIVKTGKEKEEEISKQVTARNTQRTIKYNTQEEWQLMKKEI